MDPDTSNVDSTSSSSTNADVSGLKESGLSSSSTSGGGGGTHKRWSWVTKLLFWLLLTPILLCLLVFVLLYIPPVQRAAVSYVEKQLNSSGHYHFDLGSIHLGFPLGVSVKEVSCVDLQKGDTLLVVGKLRTSLSVIPLLQGRVETTSLDLKGFKGLLPNADGTMVLSASAQHLGVGDVSVNLSKGDVSLGAVSLEKGSFKMFSIDTIKNPNKKPLNWQIGARRIDLKDMEVDIKMPYSSLYVGADIRNAGVDNFHIRLDTITIKADYGKFDCRTGSYAQDSIYPTTPYMEFTNIHGKDAKFELTHFYLQGSHIEMFFKNLSLSERCGGRITHLDGKLFLKDGVLETKDVDLTTALNSHIVGNMRLPFSIFHGDSTAYALADMRGQLSSKDLFYFSHIDLLSLAGQESGIDKTPMQFDVDAEGDFNSFEMRKLELHSRDLVDLSAKGSGKQLLNNKTRKANVTLSVTAYSGLEKVLPQLAPSLVGKLTIPNLTTLKGMLKTSGEQLQSELSLSAPGRGSSQVKASYHTGAQQYNVRLLAESFGVASFMPQLGIDSVDASLQVDGRGFDVLSHRTLADVQLQLSSMQYHEHLIDSIQFQGKLSKGLLNATLHSGMDAAKIQLLVDGHVEEHKNLFADVNLQIDTLNLAALGVSHDTITLSTELDSRLSSDLKTSHTLSLIGRGFHLKTPTRPIYIDSVYLSALLRPDSIAANVRSGDLKLNTLLECGLDSLSGSLNKLNRLVSNLTNDSVYRRVEVDTLLSSLPKGYLTFNMGHRNPLLHILKTQNKLLVDTTSVQLKIHQQADAPLLFHALARGIRQDTLRIDSAFILLSAVPTSNEALSQARQRYAPAFVWAGTAPPVPDTLHSGGSTHQLRLRLGVNKRAYRQQVPFNIQLSANTDLTSLAVDASYKENDSMMYKVAADLFRNANGYGLSLAPQPIYIVGKKVIPNADNALFYFGKRNFIKANVQLQAEQNGVIKLFTNNEKEEGADYIQLQVERLQLNLLNGIGGIDNLEGRTFADVKLEREGDDLLTRIVGDLSINDFKYNNQTIGTISTALFYEPHKDNVHYINAQLNVNGNLNFSAEGKYSANNSKSPIDADIQIDKLPLQLLNPILGKNTATVVGYLDGKLNVRGSTKDILLNGTATPINTMVYLPQVGETFSLEGKPLEFDNERLIIPDLRLKVLNKKSDLAMNGSLYLFGPNALKADLHFKGNEIEILDSKRKRGQMLYGRILASADISVQGKLSAPKVRGGLALLGGTDATYVYTGSKLKNTDNMAGVVVFKEFADTLFTAEEPKVLPSFGGADIAVDLHIDPAVRLGVDLDASHQDYVSVMGGGDLRMVVPPFGDMSLMGSYNISEEGTVRYNFPVVGRKVFKIDPDSRIAWSGPVMTPYINFKAVNRVRSEVVENKQSRKVLFDVLIVLKETDSGYTIVFDLEAPEDLSIQNQLAAMSAEERGKQAVALLVSGTYLAGEQSQASLEKMLSNLAVSELNNITGKLLSGTDINVGMDLHNGEMGNTYTDYTYSFSKRFYNDRIRVVFGGHVAAGNLPANYEQTFIDNVTLEYRLDRSGSQYVSLFHKRNNDNLLEGIVTETGVSYIFRKKLFKLSDLFMPGKRNLLPNYGVLENAPADSVKTDKPKPSPADSTSRTSTKAVADSLTTSSPQSL